MVGFVLKCFSEGRAVVNVPVLSYLITAHNSPHHDAHSPSVCLFFSVYFYVVYTQCPSHSGDFFGCAAQADIGQNPDTMWAKITEAMAGHVLDGMIESRCLIEGIYFFFGIAAEYLKENTPLGAVFCTTNAVRICSLRHYNYWPRVPRAVRIVIEL